MSNTCSKETSSPPTKEGYYMFSCEESDNVPELVFIYQQTLNYHDPDDGLWTEKSELMVFSDMLWQNLKVFHDNLTDPKWHKVDHRKIRIVEEEKETQLTEELCEYPKECVEWYYKNIFPAKGPQPKWGELKEQLRRQYYSYYYREEGILKLK